MNDEIMALINDETTSFWLKNALLSALQRDPLDALKDASLLHIALHKHFENLIQQE